MNIRDSAPGSLFRGNHPTYPDTRGFAPTPIKVEDVVRLQPHIYAQLEKQFGEPRVTDQTSPAQAGYQLGVQAVLKALRVGFVIS